jgi:hypothetical protein
MTASHYDAHDEHDYARFEGEVKAWGSIEDFVGALPVPAGVHVVSLPGGAHLDLMVRGDLASIAPDAVLGVYFSAAVSGRADKRPPFFSGSGMSDKLGLPAISLSDPGLEGDGKLSLGWYTGHAGEHMQDTITQLLGGLADRLHRELLLIGGSGAGFAALTYAHRLGRRASALVWNPQTDILDYIRPTVERYLRDQFDDPVDLSLGQARQALSKRLIDAGIHHAVRTRPSTGGARRVLYLQNAGDWHLRAHARPYVEGFALRPDGPGTLAATDRDHRLVVSRVAEGHGVPPYKLLSGLVRTMSRTATTTAEAIEQQSAEGLLPAPTADLPADLREQASDLEARASLAAVRRDDDLEVTVSGIPDGVGGHEVHVVATGPSTTVSGSAPSGAVHLLGTEAAELVRATVYDGFGHPLFTLRTEEIAEASPVTEPEAPVQPSPASDSTSSPGVEGFAVSVTSTVRGRLDVTVSAPERSRATLTLYRGQDVADNRDWSLDLTHSFQASADGRYRVRAFVLDPDGNRQAITSDWCEVVS